MILIANTLAELSDSITATNLISGTHAFPTEFQTYAEAWEELRQSIDHLQNKLGDERHAKLQQMLTQAKAHYDAERDRGDQQQGDLGSWLMQDIALIVDGKAPLVYPKELYRWPR